MSELTIKGCTFVIEEANEDNTRKLITKQKVISTANPPEVIIAIKDKVLIFKELSADKLRDYSSSALLLLKEGLEGLRLPDNLNELEKKAYEAAYEFVQQQSAREGKEDVAQVTTRQPREKSEVSITIEEPVEKKPREDRITSTSQDRQRDKQSSEWRKSDNYRKPALSDAELEALVEKYGNGIAIVLDAKIIDVVEEFERQEEYNLHEEGKNVICRKTGSVERDWFANNSKVILFR